MVVDVPEAVETPGMKIVCEWGATLLLVWKVTEGSNPRFWLTEVPNPNPQDPDVNRRVHIFPPKKEK